MNPLKQAVEKLITQNLTSTASKEHYCSECGSFVPKKEIEVLGVKRLVQPVCECEAEKSRLEWYRSTPEYYERIESLKWCKKNMGERYANSAFDNFTIRDGAEKALEIVKAYAIEFEDWEEESLIVWGPYGNGKSHLVASVANHLIDQGKIAVFMSVPDLLSEIRKTFNKENKETEDGYIRKLINSELLILDDIGAEKVTDWVSDVLFRIIDGRYRKKKPTMYTSNLQPSLLADKVGGRIYDRINETCLAVENKATSYRREKAIKRFKKFN